MEEHAYDGVTGTAGGPAFGAALAGLAREKELDAAAFALACERDPAYIGAVFAGAQRVGISELATFARALRLRAIEFMQRAQLLSLEVYAMGLDPLFFLPDGPIRFDARIYMREINPRHAVPEGDMTKRNPMLKTLADDTVLDAHGKLEIELTYLLRAAVQSTGGKL
ncbi:MAG: hypothetical protein NVSMB64_20710 [Candidatus Velthaea sp.]